MREVSTHQENAARLGEDMPVAQFWEQHYLPYVQDVLPVTGLPRLKASTLRGYKGVWTAHLKKHFGTTTLQHYTPESANLLLDSLTRTMNSTSLKHVRPLALRSSSVRLLRNASRSTHGWGFLYLMTLLNERTHPITHPSRQRTW